MLAGAAAVVALVVGVASPASAAHKDGWCDSGELCLFYNDGLGGAWIDFYYGDNDHRNDRFIGGPGKSGYLQIVADHAQSAFNRDPNSYAVITSLLACAIGAFDVLEPNEINSRLDATWNNNWSNCWEF